MDDLSLERWVNVRTDLLSETAGAQFAKQRCKKYGKRGTSGHNCPQGRTQWKTPAEICQNLNLNFSPECKLWWKMFFLMQSFKNKPNKVCRHHHFQEICFEFSIDEKKNTLLLSHHRSFLRNVVMQHQQHMSPWPSQRPDINHVLSRSLLSKTSLHKNMSVRESTNTRRKHGSFKPSYM